MDELVIAYIAFWLPLGESVPRYELMDDVVPVPEAKVYACLRLLAERGFIEEFKALNGDTHIRITERGEVAFRHYMQVMTAMKQFFEIGLG